MASAATQQPQAPASEKPAFYFTPKPWILFGITLLPFVLLLVWLVVVYLGIEYGTPPWDTRSVPPPQLY